MQTMEIMQTMETMENYTDEEREILNIQGADYLGNIYRSFIYK